MFAWGRRLRDLPIRVRTWHHPAASFSGYSGEEQRILFLLICRGKGLSRTVREVKFKAQRSFEGHGEEGFLIGGWDAGQAAKSLRAPAVS